jgi:hypothetical protein
MEYGRCLRDTDSPTKGPRAESPWLDGLVTKGSWNQLMVVLGCTHEILLCFFV